jgi:hypothetical protein
VARRQLRQLNSPVDEEGVDGDGGCVGSLARKRRKRGIDLADSAGVKHLDLQSHGMGRRFRHTETSPCERPTNLDGARRLGLNGRFGDALLFTRS